VGGGQAQRWHQVPEGGEGVEGLMLLLPHHALGQDQGGGGIQAGGLAGYGRLKLGMIKR
jgi:hypothetical protein